MSASLLLVLSLAVSACLLGCAAGPSAHTGDGPAEAADAERETALILGVLNAETRAALGRDYRAWREHWVHEPYVVKTYTNAADGTSSVMLGWAAVDDFVRSYIEDHPTPEPPPEPLTSADVQIYGDVAWVTYEQDDADQGLKRESRRLELAGGVWRIAGMHTTILDASG
ncbi:nuclear transport factor 2 family protein [Rubrivirga sp.]|uniref:nuclear transport factor 2 family protein n=1 Tax=Rubrivirga sp. TaxID=1885344 RepID=UPI003B51C7AF